MRVEARKVDALDLGPYHVNLLGERVTPETCTCYQCAMQRAMEAQLDALDETYRDSDAVRHLRRDEMARLARVRFERRQRVIDTFLRVGFIGCTMPMAIKVAMRVELEQIEVARDAWQEDQGGERWREMLKEHPRPIQNYIGKRFEAERAELARVAEKYDPEKHQLMVGYRPRFRITSLTYAPDGALWAIVDNTPGENG